MENHCHDIEVPSLRKAKRKKNLLRKTIPPLSPGNSKKEKDKPGNNAGKTKIPFDKWIMPPEPEGYIKYPRYDFL